jgi:hypothetical protein
MEEHKPYDPEVYKRLDLVQKQFKRHTAEQKKEQSVARRRGLMDQLARNKQEIIRWAVYVFLGLLVLGVIGVTIAEVISR